MLLGGCLLEDASWRILLQELFTENSVRSSQKNIQMHQSSNYEVDLVIGEGAYESSFSLLKSVHLYLHFLQSSTQSSTHCLPIAYPVARLIACRSLTCLSDCLSESVNKNGQFVHKKYSRHLQCASGTLVRALPGPKLRQAVQYRKRDCPSS